ncbi:MAG TPA: DNA repair protein RecO [Oligoflexia bacterium]|nr:DNA repair protein RecO [Oligoflexia bacterium]HMP47955.1 DNA repair protein RecO [Oligoflexia bacterium]
MNNNVPSYTDEITKKSHAGLVLTSIAYGESNLLLEILFREFGKKKIIARGIRNSRHRMSGSLEIFEYASFDLSKSKKGNIFQLEGISGRRAFGGLRANTFSFEAASLLIEIASALIPEDDPESGQLLTFIFRTLSRLEKLYKTNTEKSEINILTGYACLAHGIIEICRNAGLDPSYANQNFHKNDQSWLIQMLDSGITTLYYPIDACYRTCSDLRKYVEQHSERRIRSQVPKVILNRIRNTNTQKSDFT